MGDDRLLAEVQALVASEILPRAGELDESNQFSWEIARAFSKLGLLALTLPRAYGGGGHGLSTLCRVVEAVATASPSTALLLVVQSLALQAIRLGADEEQQRTLLPAIVREQRLLAFALTERSSGSDVASLRTRAVAERDGYRLSGTKHFVSFGAVADLVLVFASTGRARRHAGISLFLVERDRPGVRVGEPLEGMLGMRGSAIAHLAFRNVYVPRGQRLGPEGAGFRVAMRALERSRLVIGAQAVGIAQAALEQAVAYAKRRRQFGRPIGRFQGLQFMLADMATRVEASRALVARAAQALDTGAEEGGRLSAMAKLHATDSALRVAADAMQVLGGTACFRGSPTERALRDAKISQIYEGTNQIQRLVIARSLLGPDLV